MPQNVTTSPVSKALAFEQPAEDLQPCGSSEMIECLQYSPFQSSPTGRRGVSTHLGLALALLALLGMAAWSWGRLVEIQVDFGREVYFAWQMASGKRLYADLVYYYGPLSPYFNALLFEIFGVSLRTLMVGNLVIAGLITVVLYLLFRGWADAFAETIASLVFPLLFACGSYALRKSFITSVPIVTRLPMAFSSGW